MNPCRKCMRPSRLLPYGRDCARMINAAVAVLLASNNPVAIATAKLLTEGALTPVTTHRGLWTVKSSRDPGVIYLVTPDRCLCPSGQHWPDRLCKHRMAATILAA